MGDNKVARRARVNTPELQAAKVPNPETLNTGPLTDPEVVKPLAHGAALVWDLVEVLVEARLQGDEPGQGREVVLCGSNTQFSSQLLRMQLLAVSEHTV